MEMHHEAPDLSKYECLILWVILSSSYALDTPMAITISYLYQTCGAVQRVGVPQVLDSAGSTFSSVDCIYLDPAATGLLALTDLLP